MEHLSDKARSLINVPNDEKIFYMNTDRWIGYPRSQEVLNSLEDLMCYPKTDRMPNLLIIGDSNNGKTKILKQFLKRYPVDIDEDTALNIQPVVMVSAPSKPDENSFYIRLLQELCTPYVKNESASVKRERVIRVLKKRKTRMLIIDEIQHVIAGSYNSQKNFLNAIKDLSNTLQIPIVGSGIEDAFHAIQVDPQLANRFQVEILPRWKVNTPDNTKNFARLIASIEKGLVLPEASHLYKKPYLDKIYYLSEGLIGEVFQILRQLAIFSIKNDQTSINEETFEALGLIPPSSRRKLLSQLR
ncbi:TniB family NTP-binding protein [Psychrobacter cryohalolentis]|uniref:TniB family NTP-binding protein n=1 Tax=Psychrobacter sp. D2 TaxID=2759702 RepID=UPI0015E59F30|nr:TniB family NTP-binding protein [Psychrobacter sp. D2]MBA2056310.1 TniB family NTP-binding protein [Psychrobacter sp. D2]